MLGAAEIFNQLSNTQGGAVQIVGALIAPTISENLDQIASNPFGSLSLSPAECLNAFTMLGVSNNQMLPQSQFESDLERLDDRDIEACVIQNQSSGGIQCSSDNDSVTIEFSTSMGHHSLVLPRPQ
jgi:hypothetical protein